MCIRDRIKHMVNRFLAWKLPPDFHPDAGIRFASIYEPSRPGWPIGTNLLTANQAEAMIRHLLDGMPALRAPAGEPVAWMYEQGGRSHVSPTRVTSQRDAFWGWTETPLYAAPPAPDRGALREEVAKAICRAYAIRAGADDEAVELQVEYALEFWLDEADAAIAAMNPAAIRKQAFEEAARVADKHADHYRQWEYTKERDTIVDLISDVAAAIRKQGEA